MLISAVIAELLDRREHDTKTLVATISQWITTAPARPFALLTPAAMLQ